MRIPTHTRQFRRDYKKVKRSGRNVAKLNAVLDALIDGKILPSKYRDHALQGKMQHLRDCHIEGDWMLLYELGTDDRGKETITFHATDNHENLFG